MMMPELRSRSIRDVIQFPRAPLFKPSGRDGRVDCMLKEIGPLLFATIRNKVMGAPESLEVPEGVETVVARFGIVGAVSRRISIGTQPAVPASPLISSAYLPRLLLDCCS